jgi:sulfite reductase beta subunit-like hemoprotein
MADLYAADMKVEDTITTLEPLLKKYAADRNDGEGLGDFYQRILGRTETRRRVTGKEEATFDQVQPLVQLG